MDKNTLKESFSISAFLHGLLITFLAYFLINKSIIILLVGAILSLIGGILVKYIEARRNKKRYIEILEEKSKESFDLIIANTRQMLIDPVHVESVHQLRVSIRRFRAIISLAKPHMDLDSYVEIQDYFRQRGRELAPLREFDVLIETIENIEGLKILNY